MSLMAICSIFSLLRLRSISCCWCFTFCIVFGHVPKQVLYAARVVPFVVVPALNLHEGGVQLDASLENEVMEIGLVSKSVKTSASSV